MTTAWQQDRRRAQARGVKEDNAEALKALIGGVTAAIDVPEAEKRKLKAEEEAKRKADLEAEAGGARKTMAEASLLRAKSADDARKDSLLRKKEADADKKATTDAKAAKDARDESVLRRKEAVLDAKRATEGGLSRADLEKRAEELGVPPDQLLAEADMLNRDEMLAEDKTKAKTEADLALADQRDAAAEKARRGPVTKPVSPTAKRMADAKLRKAEAEATTAERSAKGGGPANAKAQSMSGELAEKRALKVSGLNLLDRLRMAKKKVGTGPIEGPAKDILGMVVSNPDRDEFAQLNNAVQRIAGRILEGGKLAEGDARTYEKFILNPNKLDDAAYERLLDSIQTMLEDDLTTFDQEMAAAGKSVGSRDLDTKPAAAKPAADKATMSDDDIATRRAQIAARRAELKGKQ